MNGGREVVNAVAEGKNMVITHEPTFYAHDDGTKPLEGNATLAAKQAACTASSRPTKPKT